MSFSELRLRVAPWIVIPIGVIWLCLTLVANGSRTGWRDVYPPVCLIGVGILCRVLIRYLDRPGFSEENDTEANDGAPNDSAGRPDVDQRG